MTPPAPANILLVDDRPENLLALESILEGPGVVLVRASSGEEALRRIFEADYAAVLLDVQMPGMGGLEVAKLIRSRDRSRYTPIIFLTAFHSDDLPVREAYALGAVDFLVKPLVPEVLRAKVAFFVEYFRQAQQLREAERLRAEVALRGQQQLWHTTLSSIGDAVISTDPQARVTFLNPEAERLTGWPRAEAAGRHLDEVLRIVDDATGERIACAAERVRDLDSAVRLPLPMTLIATDGTRRPIEDTAAPIRNEAGELLGVVVVFRDVSERRRAAEALRASEERLRLLDAIAKATESEEDPGEIMGATARFLGEHLAATRVSYADVDGDRFIIRHDWTSDEVESAAGIHSLEAFGRRAAALLRAGRPVVLRHVSAELAPGDGLEAFRALGIEALVRYPLVKGGRLTALMSVHQAAPRDWTPREIALVGEVVERSWAHIQRVRDAAALREKDERLKLLVENIEDYAVVICDVEGTITEWQGGAERITRFAASEAIGRKLAIFYTPDDRDAGVPEIEMRTAARLGRSQDKRWHQRKDGSGFFADGVMVALYDGERLRGFGKLFKDATREKRAEEAQRLHTEQLRALADVATRLNAVHDLRSLVHVVTEESRKLIGARQATARIAPDPDQTFDHASYSDALRGAMTAAAAPDRSGIAPAVAAGHQPVRLTHGQLAAHPAWASFREAAEAHPPMRGLLAAPVVGRSGQVLGVVQLSEKEGGDFTEEDEAILVQLAQTASVAVENTRLYQALREADRRKDEFLAMLAHELRNPLAPIQNALAVLDRKGSREDPAVRLREIIRRQVTHLSRLVDDLLDVARITSGKVMLKKEPVELSRVLAQALETSRPLIDAKRHALATDVTQEPIWLDADAVRLAQVISNLLNNAAKYTDEGGQIRLVARREGGHAVVRVADTGIGLSQEMLPRVFDLFTQASAGIARTAGGLGIGLTLVRKLVELHGGSVSVTSNGAGKGSEFIVRLPVRAVAAAETEAPENRRAKIVKKVMVVDDNVDSVETMGMLLEMLGHVVETAGDGIQAVDVARAFRPEIVFLDLGLPGRDGYEVARVLRQDFPRGAMRLVALSGYGQDEDRRRSREAGFDAHLVKPVDVAALEREIAQAGAA